MKQDILLAGHIIRLIQQSKNITKSTDLRVCLGGLAGTLSGRADVGAAIILGGADVATQNFLSYSRAEERAADQIAVNLLDQTKQTTKGFYEFMKKLEGQELLSSHLPITICEHASLNPRENRIYKKSFRQFSL